MDELIFKSLFNKAYLFCKPRLLRLTGSPTDAKEVFAKAIKKYWEKHQEGSLQNIEKPEHYIFTIAKHIWYDQQKKKKREYLSSDEELSLHEKKQQKSIEEEEFDALVKKENEKISNEERQKQTECLNRAFKKLKPKCHKLLTAVFFLWKKQPRIKKYNGL